MAKFRPCRNDTKLPQRLTRNAANPSAPTKREAPRRRGAISARRKPRERIDELQAKNGFG